MNPFWPQGYPIEVRSVGPVPHTLCWRGDEHRIDYLSARWRVHTRWWTAREVWRDYWEVATGSGYLCVLYRDLLHDDWYLERVYE
ncbi:MAG: hypothetical protein R6V13_10110 [Anaerolineae bacterium]